MATQVQFLRSLSTIFNLVPFVLLFKAQGEFPLNSLIPAQLHYISCVPLIFTNHKFKTFCAYYFRLLVYFHLSFVVASFLRNIFSQISVNREIKIHAKQYHILLIHN